MAVCGGEVWKDARRRGSVSRVSRQYSPYVHAQPLTTELNTIGIGAMCEFYIPFVLNFIDRDMLLIDLIEKELPHDTDLDSTKPLSRFAPEASS